MKNEMRLIDANKADVEYIYAYHGSSHFELQDVQDWLDGQPTVEATVFPCKIGDPVWFVGTSNINRLKMGVIEATVEKLVLKSGGIYMKLSCNAMYETSCRSIGKTVFFSKEEAEAALAKMNGGNEDG